MTLSEMNATALSDLNYIPRGPWPQGVLRAVYQQARMASLGRKRQLPGTALDILQWCLRLLQAHFPGHTFEYDETYFRSQGAHA